MYAYWKISQRQEAGRPLKWVTPCKRSAARGRKSSLTLELRRSSTHFGVEGEVRILSIPALRFACTGLFTFKAYSGLLPL
jgi:hypothetical protein